MLRFFQPLLALAVLLASGAASAVRAEDENAGISFTLRVQPRIDPDTGREIPVTHGDLDQTQNTLEKRLDNLGVTELLIATRKDDTLVLQLPGIETEMLARVRMTLRKAGKLELREVHPASASLAEPVFHGEELMPGYRACKHEGQTPEGEAFTEFLLLNKRSVISNSDVTDAWPMTQGSEPMVGVKLSRKGGDKMAASTKNMRHGVDRLAVVLDGQVFSAPTVMTKLGRNFVIMGQDSFEDASELASEILHPFDPPLEIVTEEPLPESPRTSNDPASEGEADSR